MNLRPSHKASECLLSARREKNCGLGSGTRAAPSHTIAKASNSAQQATGVAAPLKTMTLASACFGAAAVIFL